MLPAVDRQVPPPVVRIAPVDDAAARIDALDLIGAAAERRRECRLLEGHRRVVGLRDDRHEPEDQRQLTVRRLGVEVEAHRALVGPLDLPHLVVIEPVVGPALLLQRLPRENDVVDSDRAAVVEVRFRPQPEQDGRAVVRHLDRFRDQPVEGERLVPGALEQALEGMVPPRRRHALDDEGVESVEGAHDGAPKLAALGRVWG